MKKPPDLSLTAWWNLLCTKALNATTVADYQEAMDAVFASLEAAGNSTASLSTSTLEAGFSRITYIERESTTFHASIKRAEGRLVASWEGPRRLPVSMGERYEGPRTARVMRDNGLGETVELTRDERDMLVEAEGRC